MVKMFSRDKEDAAQFTRVKKGMWVRVRGSIQNDTFVRDLSYDWQMILMKLSSKHVKIQAPEG